MTCIGSPAVCASPTGKSSSAWPHLRKTRACGGPSAPLVLTNRYFSASRRRCWRAWRGQPLAACGVLIGTGAPLRKFRCPTRGSARFPGIEWSQFPGRDGPPMQPSALRRAAKRWPCAIALPRRSQGDRRELGLHVPGSAFCAGCLRGTAAAPRRPCSQYARCTAAVLSIWNTSDCQRRPGRALRHGCLVEAGARRPRFNLLERVEGPHVAAGGVAFHAREHIAAVEERQSQVELDRRRCAA